MVGPDFLKSFLVGEGFSFDATDRVWMASAGTETFAYTDGADFERDLLACVRRHADRSVLSPDLQGEIVDWPSRYHLSSVRANLLRPLASWISGRRVLEIGAGCGALTRFLGECGGDVLAVEGSVARARVAAARTADLEGVTVLASPLQVLRAAPLFDLVTLVGVLEYARLFFPAGAERDGVNAMLAHASSFLRPGGVLLVAIENQLGLKYFSGYREDHVSEPMFGIEDRYAPDGVVTFGRRELGARVAAQGLMRQSWLYPFPDYKLPTAILTERGIGGGDGADLSALLSASVVADPQIPANFYFSLEQAWKPVFRNGLAGELANSFVLLASAEPVGPIVAADVLGWHYAVQRERRFAKEVLFRVGQDRVWVDAERLCPDLADDSNGDVVLRLKPALFEPGRLWHDELVAALNSPGWTMETLVGWAGYWLERVLAELAGSGGGHSSDLQTILPGHLVDAVPRNLVVGPESSVFIDLEWELRGGVRLGHLCYRALALSLMAVSSVAPPREARCLSLSALLDGIMCGIGFAEGLGDSRQWHRQEQAFQEQVNGSGRWLPFEAVAGYRLPSRTR